MESYDGIYKGGKEDIMYLKVLYNLDGPEIDKRILQGLFEFQFCLKLPQLMLCTNGDIQPLYGIPRKEKGIRGLKDHFRDSYRTTVIMESQCWYQVRQLPRCALDLKTMKAVIQELSQEEM